MHRTTVDVFMLLAILVSATLLSAQGRGAGSGVPMYNSKTEVTFAGSVEDVLQQHSCMGKQPGVHLMVKTPSETEEICVGPSGFIEQKGFSFLKGDRVEITGSRLKLAGKEVVVARQITKDNETLTLRNAQGVPLWSGGRRRTN
jgi:hypothetical protein